MRISRLKIRNLLGIEELEFNAGKFVHIAGPNGSGKSSVLEAIKAVFKGGHDATILRTGTDKGEIVFELDDGTEITKIVREHTSDLKIRRPGSNKPLPKPKELLDNLVDQLSNNPIEFLLERDEKRRVDVLLETMPIVVDLPRLQQISGVSLPPNAEHMHMYQLFDHVHTTVYEDRTGTSRAVDEKKKTIIQLTQAMPALPEGVVGGELELEAKLVEIDANKDLSLTEVHEKLTTYSNAVQANIATVTAAHDESIRKYQDAMDSEIAELQKLLDQKRSEKLANIARMRAEQSSAVTELQNRISTTTARADAKRLEIKKSHQEARGPVEAQLNILRSNRDMAARRAQTQETIKALEAELKQLEADVERQNRALDAINAYKSEVLQNLPIPGLEVRAGKIYRNGVVFNRLNLEQRMNIGIEIAKLRAGDLGVVCVDGIEAFDSAHFEEFKRQANNTDLQFIVTRVSDHPFAISTDQPSF
jgi:DNA repair exonuclease SbcCD ATPase subunit